MSGPKGLLYKSEERMSRSDRSKLFREIAKRIDKGSLTLRSTEKETSVQFPEQLELEISWGAGVGDIRLA